MAFLHTQPTVNICRGHTWRLLEKERYRAIVNENHTTFCSIVGQRHYKRIRYAHKAIPHISRQRKIKSRGVYIENLLYFKSKNSKENLKIYEFLYMYCAYILSKKITWVPINNSNFTLVFAAICTVRKLLKFTHK